MDICEKKNQVQNLLNDIFNEYNRMNETKIQSNCENNLEMRNMIDTIRSLETTSTEKDNKIQSLEKTNHEYSNMINELQSKLELEKEETQEENKFKTTIIQANEIHKKDMEIERLNNIIKGLREKLNTDKKIDTILNNIDTNVKLEVEEIEFREPEPFSHESIHINDNLEENISNPEPVSKGKILTVKYKNVKYLVYENENPQHVYEFNTDKNPENMVGKRTRNVKTGKYKIVLN